MTNRMPGLVSEYPALWRIDHAETIWRRLHSGAVLKHEHDLVPLHFRTILISEIRPVIGMPYIASPSQTNRCPLCIKVQPSGVIARPGPSRLHPYGRRNLVLYCLITDQPLWRVGVQDRKPPQGPARQCWFPERPAFRSGQPTGLGHAGITKTTAIRNREQELLLNSHIPFSPSCSAGNSQGHHPAAISTRHRFR